MAQTSAYFKVTLPNFRNRTYVGQVTEKNGKLSYKGDFNGQYGYCAAERYQIKAAVAKAWPTKDPAIFSDITVSNDGLVETLRKHTKDLYEVFIQKTKEYAERMHKIATDNYNKPLESFYPSYGIELETIESYGRIIKRVTKETKNAEIKLHKDRSNWYGIKVQPYENFEAKEIKHANDHYENSLLRLAARLEAKGIKGNFTAVSGRVGLNFEVVINHGDTITRAWTIIAEGPIVRAHYRYLVK
jgi:phosphopantetheinyl transferase (holo-ACP synthase)